MERFSELFEAKKLELNERLGVLLEGKVLDIQKKTVIIDCDLKSDVAVALEQFIGKNGELEIQTGDTVQLALEMLDDGMGETRASREKARRIISWKKIESAMENGNSVEGMVTSKIKGGFVVDIDGVRAFLPGSLVELKPVKDASYLEGQEISVKVIKLSPERNNIVVSRRAVLAEENSEEREALLATLQPGTKTKGIVKNLIDYGAFVDLGGIDGLLHITDITWKRVRHPSDVLSVGQELELQVLRYEEEKNRVSLGLKQLTPDPWQSADFRYQPNTTIKSKVTNITDYGFFAEVEDGIEGLVHTSELDWTNKNIHASKLVSIGDEVDVMVLSVDKDARRLSLGYKQCRENPWSKFAEAHNKGEKIKGPVSSVTDFGVFVSLEDKIDGLIHLSSLSWDLDPNETLQQYKRGQEVEAVIMNIDVERERISLSIKHLTEDNFNSYVNNNRRSASITGSVIAVTPKGAQIQLAEDVTGYMEAVEISNDEEVRDATQHLQVGDSIDCKIIHVDRKARKINLSKRARERQQNKEAIALMKKKAKENKITTTIGELIKKEQLEDN